VQVKKINIAIDGPAGAGKSTIARKVAQALGYIYVDTGAMYRAVTWQILQDSGWPQQESVIIPRIKDMKIEIVPTQDGQLVIVNGIDVTKQIRSTEVTQHVSEIARIAEVRHELVAQQQRLATHKGVVMDGRDIATKVMPDAEIKIFLTASIHERAMRRLKEWQNHEEITKTLTEIENDISIRDQMDEQRAISPLVRAEEAILLDSTSMSIDEVVEYILDLCHSAAKGGP
jgi:cytidylate kinase